MGSLSLCDVFGCDLKFGLPQSKSRDLRRDRFRQFPLASRFDTVWARSSLSKLSPPRHSDDCSYQEADIFKVHSEEAGWPLRLLGWLRLICSEASRV